MAKRLSDEEVIKRTLDLGHHYLKHYRNDRGVLTIEYNCGSCGTHKVQTLNNLNSPRCHNCKIVNYAFTQKSLGKAKMQRTTRRKLINSQIKEGSIKTHGHHTTHH